MLDMKNPLLSPPSSQFYTAGNPDIQTMNTNVRPEMDHHLNLTVNTRRLLMVNQVNPYDHSISHGHLGFPGFSSNSDRSARQSEEDDFLSQKTPNQSVEISSIGRKRWRDGSERIKTASFEEHSLAQPQQITTKLPLQARRSQKLADKITVLQKLVSPYGKTSTADVLEEASLYIEHLHQQIEALSSFCNTNTEARSKETTPDLRSRGLCLVPVSCSWKVIAICRQRSN